MSSPASLQPPGYTDIDLPKKSRPSRYFHLKVVGALPNSSVRLYLTPMLRLKTALNTVNTVELSQIPFNFKICCCYLDPARTAEQFLLLIKLWDDFQVVSADYSV